MENPEIRVINGESYFPITTESDGRKLLQRIPKKLDHNSNHPDFVVIDSDKDSSDVKTLAKKFLNAIVKETEKSNQRIMIEISFT